LTIDEFFDGNEYVGSIGCNLEGAPPPSRFYELFKSIAAKPQVSDIRVQITMFDQPEWPFSDQVFILTSATVAEVESWFPKELKPDEVGESLPFGDRYEPYSVPAGARAIHCWWD
jgi:hypothetical protein